MYENYTYEYILNSILNRITAFDPSIDIREGSAMWYAVAPVASELAIAYTNCDAIHKESFVGTASREGLYRACEDIGLDTNQFEANSGVFLGHFDAEVTIGSRWACGDYIFGVTSKVGTVTIDGVVYQQYRLTCETKGSHTQYTIGNLRPITEYGSNSVAVAVLDECVIAGADEAIDEKVRETYFKYIAEKSEGGNVAQYNQWLSEFDGIGGQKIVPTWNGANTVKVAIIDENKEAPTSELVATVQEYLDPNKEGLGEGKAPIGAVVTVVGGTNAYIDVRATITLASATADTSDISDNLRNYFRKIAFEKTTINIYEVASVILASASVADVNDVRIGRYVNGSTSYANANLTLGDFETPVLHAFYNN